jgi:O-antigen/teichoic acid export membrane protein
VELRAKVLAALRWSATGRFGAQLISWALTLLVLRVLTPGDYGLLAMATVAISLLMALNDLGLDAVLVQKRDLSLADRQHVFGAVIATNGAMCGLLAFGAPSIAAFYGEPRLTAIVRVLALQFLIAMFETLPLARLERELEFKGRAMAEMVGALSASLLTAALAFGGCGVWSLVAGMLAGSASRTLALNRLAGEIVRPRWSIAAIRRHLPFGGSVCGYRASYVVFAEVDKFIGGKLLGKEVLGQYTVAAHFATLPIQKLAGLFQAVAFPAFARAKSETGDVRGAVLQVTRATSLVAFPLFLGTALVSPELVALVLGPAWTQVAVPLAILSLVMPLRLLSTLLTPLVAGLGRPGVNAANQLLAVVIMAPLLLLGAQRGPAGLALAWLVGYPAVFAIYAWSACRVAGIRPAEYFHALAQPFVLSALMYAVVSAARPYVADSGSDAAQLATLVGLGAAVYAVGLLVSYREELKSLEALLRSPTGS